MCDKEKKVIDFISAKEKKDHLIKEDKADSIRTAFKKAREAAEPNTRKFALVKSKKKRNKKNKKKWYLWNGWPI